MRTILHGSSRRLGSVAAAAITSTLLFFGAGPSGGQGGGPTARVARLTGVPRKAQTAAEMEFTLPPGIALRRKPRFRVTNSEGKLVEMLPALITQRGSTWRATRALRTGTYRPGTYQVQVELDTADGRGVRGKLLSPAVALTVP